MKKILLSLLALCAATSLWAYDFQSGLLYYNILSDSTAEVTYQEFSSNSYSPSYESYSKTGSPNNYSTLTAVTIPETVTTIEGYAFVFCLALTEVTIPKNVTIINFGAFNNCNSLATVKVKATTPPTLYDNDTFSGCSSDLKVYVPTASVNAYMSTDYWKNLTILSDIE